jgi:GntR family transcriptional regulator / MocR family aminotransferase
MKKVAGSFTPVIAIDRRTAKPLHRQVYDAYRTAIVEGNLRPGERVPSSRELAIELGVSRIPVLNAYAQLLSEGLLESRRSVGTFVSKSWFGWPSKAPRKSEQSVTRSPSRPISGRAKALPTSVPWHGEGAFAIGQVAADLFPFHVWSRLVVRHSRDTSGRAMNASNPMGSLEFRKVLAAYLRTVRAVKCEPEQIMVVSGSQQALDLTARVIFDPGDRVWVEEPGYWLAHRVFAAAGCKIVPVPVDSEGLVVDAGLRAAPRARAAFVTPSHQAPLGWIMSASRRVQLLGWAEKAGSWIIEDDYDCEYRYGAMPVTSLQGLDRNQRVIYVGTFSKTVFSGMRLGYIVIPTDLIDRFLAMRQAMDRFPARLYQDVLSDFIAAGHYARHLRRTGKLYQERREVLVDALKNEFGDALGILGAAAGLYLPVTIPNQYSDARIAQLAAKERLWLYPLSAFYFKKAELQGFPLGFSNVGIAHIRAAVRQMRKLFPDAM